jgi:small multidrug resistance family-3 protein
MNLSYVWPLLLLLASILEVSGDAAVRKGLRGDGVYYIVAGCIALGCYGIAVNLLRWDFGRLLGVYVAVFALVSILWGHYIFKETVAHRTKVGVAIIMIGGFVISWPEVKLLVGAFIEWLRAKT